VPLLGRGGRRTTVSRLAKILSDPGRARVGQYLLSGEIVHNEDMRQVLIYRGEDGLWVAECPSLSGCVSQGETQESALANIREAINAYVEALEADNLPVPEEHFDARLVTV
jgi:predicted RNase H-like HicB family nuclease